MRDSSLQPVDGPQWGKLLWSFDRSAGVNAPPTTWRVDGRQNVPVVMGGNQLFGYKYGETVFVFRLDE